MRLVLAFVALMLPAAAGAAELPTLVVAPLRAIEAAGSASQIISEQIRAFVGRSGKYTLVSPEEMEALDAELARQLSGGCDQASCVAQLGGALGAQYLLTGSLGLIGKTYVLNLKLIDIETTSAKANAKPIMASSLDKIVRRVDEATADVLGASPAAAKAEAPRPRAQPTKTVQAPVQLAATQPSPATAPSVTQPKAALSGFQIAGIIAGVAVTVLVAAALTGGFGPLQSSADGVGGVNASPPRPAASNTGAEPADGVSTPGP